MRREQIVLMREQTSGALDAINAVLIDSRPCNGRDRHHPPFLHFRHSFLCLKREPFCLRIDLAF